MSYLMSAFLGLVQGIAEFLPISSSGHLALMQNLLDVKAAADGNLFFDVLLHFGTLIAIFIVYWNEIVEMVLEFFRGIAALFSRRGNGMQQTPPARRMVLLIIISTLPLFVALLFNDYVETLSSNTTFIGCALIATGCLLFFSDRVQKGKKTERSATVLDAVLVGVAQAFAIVPGLSRSGSTISAGLLRGYDRKFAVRYSFILSIPAVLGATILETTDAVKAGIDMTMIPVYLVGMVVAAVSGYFAIRLVNLLADKGKFGKFAYYCWAVGLIAVIASLMA